MKHLSESPIAIVGMGCRLPGADNLEEFWKLLLEGRSALGEMPPDRLNQELQYSPEKGNRTRSYSREGGVANEQGFPPGECSLAESIIECSHTSHITLCNVAASACRHAGLDPYNLSDRNVGVFIGHTPPSCGHRSIIFARLIEEIAQYIREIRNLDQMAQGERESIIREIIQDVRSQHPLGDPLNGMRGNAYHGPALISTAFDLDGPSMAFDAACASSFRALGHGIRSLQRNQINMALVGGASYCHGDTLVVFSQAQSVSTSGSRPFDDNASGLVAAGGYVVLALKRLEDAVQEHNPILAVINGMGVSSDGKGKSLWAPLVEGQVEAVRRAYQKQNIFSELQYIEMHATSTQVGDATELTALSQFAQEHLSPGSKIPIGSVKANIGHTLETAGIASLLKTVLAMQHGMIPPQINIEQLNTTIDWNSLPFFVPTEPKEWQRPTADSPRKAAVNAFGIGGLNVHIALQEYIPTAPGISISFPRARTQVSSSSQLIYDSIAIIGRGAILPGARTVDALWQTFQEGQDQKTDVPGDRWNKNLACEPGTSKPWRVPTGKGGFITNFEYDWKKHKVPPKQIASADPLQFMLLDAADQAMREAGYHEKPFNRNKTGVIVGTIFGGDFADSLSVGLRLTQFQQILAVQLAKRGLSTQEISDISQQYEEIFLKSMPALIDETGSFTASTLASRITKVFDLMGGAVAVDAGETSSFTAIECCREMLLAGDCDMMICAAGQRAMGLSSYLYYHTNDSLSRGNSYTPFDQNSSGFVPGEGVGVLLLKRLKDAQRDGDPIHGIIKGLGVSRSASLRNSIQNATQRCHQSAKILPHEVALLEAGSVGRPHSDREELLATLKSHPAQKDQPAIPLGSVAAQMGNLGGALGMASTLKALFELKHLKMSPLVGLNTPVEELANSNHNLHPNNTVTPLLPVNDDGRMIAGITSYAETGLAYHLLLEGPVKVPKTATQTAKQSKTSSANFSPDNLKTFRSTATTKQQHFSTAYQPSIGSWEIIRSSANTLFDLQQETAGMVEQSDQVFHRAAEQHFQPNHTWRMSIVASSPEEYHSKAKLAFDQMRNPEAKGLLFDRGIVIHQVQSTRPQVAFLFPGQGSQYHGMLKSLVEQFPPANKTLHHINQILLRENLPSFEELAWVDNSGLGEDVWRTQLSLLIANTIMLSALQQLGLRADRVGGHSFGELAALIAAQSWSFEEALFATKVRCESINQCRNAKGILVSTNMNKEEATTFCEALENRVTISHLNAPDQTVMGGDITTIQALAEQVKQSGFRAKVLDVPAPFHTPLMEEVKVPFRSGLASIRLEPPRVPLLSTVTNQYVAEPAEIRENLVLQMTKPVNYVEWVERLASEGISIFVEVGPHQVLTGLNRRILAGQNVWMMSTDHPKKDGIEKLVSVRAALETCGALDGTEDQIVIARNANHSSQSEDRSARHSPPLPLSTGIAECRPNKNKR